MKIRSNELRGKNRCVKRRKHDALLLKGSKNNTYIKASGVMNIITNALFKENGFSATMSKTERNTKVIKDSKELFDKIDFLNSKQKDIQRKISVKQIIRYLNFETRIPAFAPKKEVKCFDIDVEVSPSFLFITNDEIEVVKLRDCKPVISQTGKKRDQSVHSSMELYSMLKYGETFIPKGKDTEMRVKASYYFLRRNDETSTECKASFTAPNKANNMVSLVETAIVKSGKVQKNMIDYEFEPQFDAMFAGELCSEVDCKGCEFFENCNYKKTPAYLEKKRKAKKVAEIQGELTTSQEEAIAFRKGIARINAGAGAGKTLTIALRTAFLLAEGVSPREICLLTFTNGGAGEMTERISCYADDLGVVFDTEELCSTTFNSFCYEQVKKNYQKLGFTEEPSVIDDVERIAIIAKLLEKSNLDGCDYRNFTMDMPYTKGALPTVAKCFEIIKKEKYSKGDEDSLFAKLREIGFDRYISRTALPQVMEIYNKYDETLKKENLVEFADQELLFWDLLNLDPYYAENFGFKHIIIDEFQDSSLMQINLIKELIDTPAFESLMVVGDDSQAIFSFRDTTPEYIINFSKYIDEREVKDFNLLENHRSVKEIIFLANKLNALNTNRVIKDLIPTREDGSKPVISGFNTKEEEYEYIVKGIQEKIESGVKKEDIAFIARNKSELLEMGDLLTKAGIEWVSLNPEPVLENPRVIAAIALAKALDDSTDTKDLFIYLNCLFDNELFVKKNDDEINKMLDALQNKFENEFTTLSDKEKMEYYYELAESLDDEGCGDELFEDFLDGKIKRKTTFSSLLKYLKSFEKYGQNITFKRCKEYPGVVLSTAHSSKGLEFPIVFLSISKFHSKDLGSGSFNSPAVEEARRLLFVSMTRAKDELYITGQYTAFGKKNNYTYNRFLKELYDLSGMEFAPNREIVNLKKEKEKEERKELTAKRRKATKKSLISSLDAL